MEPLVARLVTGATEKQKLTKTREVSSVRAAVRALADYLRELSFPIDGGKHVKFSVVREMKADPEENAKYPAAAIYPEGNIDYDSDTGSFEQYQAAEFDDGGLYINGDVRTELTVHVWTNEDQHRENALMCLEDACNPVDYMTGFRLEMPFYHGLRADYLLLSVQYEDNDADVQRRYRKLIMRVRVTCPYASMLLLPKLNARAVVDVDQ